MRFEDAVIVHAQKQRTREKLQALADERRARFNKATGLKQFTVPTERPLRHTFADETANTAIGRVSR